MIVLGVDPGATGALVALQGSRVVLCEAMPYEKKVGVRLPELARLIYSLGDGVASGVHVILERAQAMPGQGVSAMFRYGEGYGAIQGVLAALGVPYETVHPLTWHKALVGQRGGEPKARALQVVQQRLPQLELPKGKLKREGVVDAACLCLYGQMRLGMQGRAA